MNTFFREDIPDSVGDTFLIETNCPYQVLLCATATFPNYSLMRNLDYSLSNEPKFKFLLLLEAEISKLQNWSNRWQNVQYGFFDIP